jgi:hypothetical protein
MGRIEYRGGNPPMFFSRMPSVAIDGLDSCDRERVIWEGNHYTARGIIRDMNSDHQATLSFVEVKGRRF